MSEAFQSEAVAARYGMARGLSQETCRTWMAELRKLLPIRQVSTVLDLGAGTGRFSAALDEAFPCSVIAVEPSEPMLEAGKATALPGVEWRHGSAERIPAKSGSIDLVWMSQVFHHLDQVEVALEEIRRVLTPQGCLAIRNGTIENEREITWTKFSYAEYYERIRQRSLSALIRISDGAFETGLRHLKEWTDSQPRDKSVYEPVDLFIFTPP